MRDELGLGKGGFEVELTPEADTGRNVPEEVVDRGDADRVQHLLQVALGEREVRVGH